MQKQTFLNVLQLYLFKKHNLRHQIANITLEYRALQRKYRRSVNLRNEIISCLMSVATDRLSINRIVWSYEKNEKWWTEIVPAMTKKQFKDNFRVEHHTFLKLVQLIGPYIEKKTTALRTAISVHKRIACALYTLGTTSELRTIAHLFGVGKTTVASIVHEFCNAIVNILFNSSIIFPSNY